ncbi:MAG: endonuclease domain-containing protein [Hyphomicrobiaceae bacterium]
MRHSQPWRTNRSRVLRANETSAEAKLWAELRNRQLGNLKFVRQAPIGNYFVDFLCRERKVIVEIDGGTHSTDAELARDSVRSDELSGRGYRVFRVSNADVFEHLDEVLAALLAFAATDEAP